MFYCASENAFYASSLRPVYDAAKTWPKDTIEVSVAIYQEFTGVSPAGKRRVAGNNGMPVWGDVLPASREELIKREKHKIDRASGNARGRFISQGNLIDAEYLQAETAAQAYVDTSYSGVVPPSVQSWVDAADITPQQAADDILATAQRWRDLLDQIRAVRLAGKAAVDKAADADIETTAQGYIDQLDAMQPAP